jgi:hypothetical protein
MIVTRTNLAEAMRPEPQRPRGSYPDQQSPPEGAATYRPARLGGRSDDSDSEEWICHG